MGVVEVRGDFDSADIVSVVDLQNKEICRGKVGLSSQQLDKVKGRRFDKEVIHRDNMVII